MSDDWLATPAGVQTVLREEIKIRNDRIEELEAENTTLRSMVADVIADTGDDPEIMAASRAEWAARALEAEAKLAKAMEHIEWFISEDETNRGDEPMPELGDRTWNEINEYWIKHLDSAIAFVAELKGEK
jgi:hypothetical protein